MSRSSHLLEVSAVFHLIFFLAVLVNGTPGASVTATRLDGASVVGELQGWVDHRLVVATDKGLETLPTDELVSVRWSSTSTPADTEEEATSTVELSDGTILPANNIQITGDHLSMTLATSASMDQKPLAIPVKQVSAVRLKTLTPRAAEQWLEIREQKRASDVLLVAKRGGESLDYIEGVLGEITVDKIEFKFDGEPLSIDRNKVAGFFYFRRGNDAHPEPRCVLHGRNGLRVSTSEVRLAENVLHIKSVGGLELDWPLAEIEFADFSAGKIRYLSDVSESTVRWTPLVALPAEASQAIEYGQPHRDRSAYGGPLTLSVPDANSPAATGRLQIFSKGLAYAAVPKWYTGFRPGLGDLRQ